MNRYQSSTPRTPIALIAIALTAITIGVMVVLPTKMGGTDASATLARETPATPAASQVATRFGRVDVVATRARKVAMTQNSTSQPKL